MVKSGEDGKFQFNDITFTQPSDGYVFKVTETGTKGDASKGWKNDTAPRTVTVKVADNHEGKLTASLVDNQTQSLQFTNVYTAVGTATVEGKKTITGRSFYNGEQAYTFKVTGKVDGGATDAAPMPSNVTNGTLSPWPEAGKNEVSINFGTITFNKPGTYTYTFEEVGPDGTPGGEKNGVTYDDTVYTVVFVVDEGTDAADGILEVTAQKGVSPNQLTDVVDDYDVAGMNVKDINWTNTYEVTPTITGGEQLKGTKTFSGRVLDENETFTFKLLPGGPTTEAAIGKYFDMPQDTTVTVKGSDLNGGGPVEFSFGDIKFRKASATGDTYAFSIVEDIPGTATNPKVTDAQGTPIPYEHASQSQKNMAGWTLNGIQYDSHAYTVFVTVKDKLDGTLEVTKYQDPNGSNKWTNTYAATGSLDIAGKKVVDNTSGDEEISPEGYEFKIELTSGDETGITLPSGTVKSDASGDFTFSGLTLNKPGEYTLKVSEVPPKNNEDKVPGVAYDAEAKTVTIGVTDPYNDGTFEANGGTALETLRFTNTYKEPEQKKDVALAVESSTSVDGQLISVGSLLVYTIDWTNDAVDENGKAVAADIIITDTVPAGTTFQSASTDGGFKLEGDKVGGTMTWTFKDAAPNATGSVWFRVLVLDDAVKSHDNTITNQATIQIGENGPTKNTNTVTNTAPEKAVKDGEGADINGDEVQVGQELTYEVAYRNHLDAPANVVVTDVIPTGTTFVSASDDGRGKVTPGDEGLLTWQFENVAPGDGGTVTLVVRVDESALEYDEIENRAMGKIGSNRGATTNTITNYPAETGSLPLSKEVGTGDVNKEFSFELEFMDSAGNKLDGSYETEYKRVSDGGGAEAPVTSGDKIELKHGEYVIINGLPAGAKYKVTETKADGYTTTINGGTEMDLVDEGSITAGATSTIAFTNTYESSVPDNDTAATNVNFTKELTGRDWTEADVFNFTLAAVTEGAPLPQKVVDGSSVDNNTASASNGQQDFSFGPITFTYDMVKDEPNKTKVFEYKVREIPHDEATNPNVASGHKYSEATEEEKLLKGWVYQGVTYDTAARTLKVTVIDSGTGVMSAVAEVDGAKTFTNTYSSGLDYDAAGGLKITKKLNGRDMASEQFAFIVKADNQESADKLGINLTAGMEVRTPVAGARDGEPVSIDLLAGKDVTFTQVDAGKTYTYTIQEQGTDGGGYDYDTAKRTVTIAVKDNGDATLTVTTTVKVEGQDGEKTFTYTTGGTNEPAAVVPFENLYSASTTDDTAAKINATKALTGRDMTDGEFSFQVIDAKNEQVVDAKGVEITGTNAAASDGQSGAITFKPIHYDTDYLKKAVENKVAIKNGDVYTFVYTVSEVTASLPDKDITPNDSSFIVTVKVTDNGDGTLTSAVDYFPYTSLAFTNTYGEAKVTLSGSKVLKVLSGNNAPNIDGKFTFTLTAADGTPMPEGNGNVAKNDASGNVKFGEISYELSDMGDATEKTFTYTVTESGSVTGVENDSDLTREITVKVTKGENGMLSATVNDGATGPAFTFTNTYSVKEESSSLTGDGNFTLTKKLDGRAMTEDEFQFVLYDAAGNEAARGSNDANGNVETSAVTFKEPNTYTYKLIEINENAAGGVTYDKASYTVTATVTDKGDGTLGVEWSAKRADGTEVAKTEPIVFTNTYEAKGATVGLGAAKLLNGGKPADGQFTFQVLDASGKVVSEAKNDEYGSVQFPELDEFTAADVYTYPIVEVDDGQAGVKYDTTEFGVKVTVSETDENGNYTGSLHATIEYTDGVPVFENAYEEPEEPVTPDPDPTDPSEPSKPGKPTATLPTTGESAWAPIAAAALVVGAGMIAVAVRMRKRS